MGIDKKPLAITMGDPSGIGPEIVVKTLVDRVVDRPVVVIGDPAVIERAIDITGAALSCRILDRLGDFDDAGIGTTIDILPAVDMSEPPKFGVVSAASGKAAYDAVIAAIDLAKTGEIAGIVTAPLHKEAMSAAGIRYPGHTEVLADKGGAERVAMMLANDELRTVLVTIHCSLRDAIERADFDAQLAAIRLAHEGCLALGIEKPRIAVAGLNPHAGEGGLFGQEEIEIISPAIRAAVAENMDVTGPWPGDTVFMQARQGRFDIVVAQYHDQGLIPVKYMGIEKGVNVTLGLPFIRTSPDHGTAFDIAGTGTADAESLRTALRYAARMADARVL
ncbi:4-hydroxythreonine-4-phosphate dehydrogenase PdxA [Hwanghaeella grinnelliae]|uniref:4-hydroxythreonine-4-phosphate dehydrogenase PdxA n=1 Tax=Hwanghaeella grinnelliae TaxID=2500179 RepID=A0A3S2VM04_9PROT|nr:4-hydroxythreonine-4-phosphate dehydrogenase PdxA [Hwanghaeella grinnelliae]RVU35921.1 4-hydroxythreonine-4-phosphate dehydrogenase PdxA [Hwanghaeella grinnelliae]